MRQMQHIERNQYAKFRSVQNQNAESSYRVRMTTNVAYINSSFHLSKIRELSTRFQTEAESWYIMQPKDVSPLGEGARVLVQRKIGGRIPT